MRPDSLPVFSLTLETGKLVGVRKVRGGGTRKKVALEGIEKVSAPRSYQFYRIELVVGRHPVAL